MGRVGAGGVVERGRVERCGRLRRGGIVEWRAVMATLQPLLIRLHCSECDVGGRPRRLTAMYKL